MQGVHSMEAELFFGSAEEAEAVLAAVKPDLRGKFARSSSSLSAEGNSLKIRIEAADLTAMRASFNSVMKCLAVSGKVLKAFEEKSR